MKVLPILGPASGAVSLGVAFLASQQAGINVSAELLISILVNVAVIALAFGKIQSSVGHLKDTADRVEKYLTDDVKRVERRVEQVATRYHHIANILVGLKLLRESEIDSDDKD